MHILFLVPYPKAQAPSQRFRFEQYLKFLDQAGFTYAFSPFLNQQAWAILYKSGYTFRKITGVAKGFAKRFLILLTVQRYDFIFIHREATPIGPPVIEWIMAKLFRKKIIYDFDDAIWLPNTSASNRVVATIKWHQKVNSICRWSYKVSCGNAYLCDFARQFNPQVVHNPTTIDTVNQHNTLKHQLEKELVIGWTGSHSTLHYLYPIFPLLVALRKKYSFKVGVIANAPPAFRADFIEFIPWNKASEIEDLLRFNVGLMPLTDDPWAKGKCGFKALQYMALGIPALVSPVGMNTEIVENGKHGFICATNADWYRYLEMLITKPDLREEMGKAGRKQVEDKYSVLSNQNNFLGLFS